MTVKCLVQRPATSCISWGIGRTSVSGASVAMGWMGEVPSVPVARVKSEKYSGLGHWWIIRLVASHCLGLVTSLPYVFVTSRAPPGTLGYQKYFHQIFLVCSKYFSRVAAGVSPMCDHVRVRLIFLWQWETGPALGGWHCLVVAVWSCSSPDASINTKYFCETEQKYF